jgi:hypothetical protein
VARHSYCKRAAKGSRELMWDRQRKQGRYCSPISDTDSPRVSEAALYAS